ncbi:Hypothetical predicted protein [Podarcis lilfordi]|uniref:Uncharacterized protein n=1 Tax=Podarcis lilfordi TaxID=74358 RepID=A0AA35L0G8_9SAUR|nr:Hypothetical predicted protein [Podarcis lilfordi]
MPLPGSLLQAGPECNYTFLFCSNQFSQVAQTCSHYRSILMNLSKPLLVPSKVVAITMSCGSKSHTFNYVPYEQVHPFVCLGSLLDDPASCKRGRKMSTLSTPGIILYTFIMSSPLPFLKK